MPASVDTTNLDQNNDDPRGVAVGPVTDWFVKNVVGAVAPLRFTLIAGGRSNYTYRVDDAAGNAFVLRRPPLGPLLPSAHDMGREFKIISALSSTNIPVAPALGFCNDPSVNERPFYVMKFVYGQIIRNADDAEKLSSQARIRSSESIVDVLSDIHALDVDAVGLGDLGKRENYLERQLKRWHSQFTQSKTREVPSVDEAYACLMANLPQQQGVSIVHGDYRTDNTMVDHSGSIVAVLDWEICTLGDPLADLGLLMVYWPEPTDDNPPLGAAASTLPGFYTRAQLVERYAKRSGRDVSQLNTYVAFGYWKLACILDGVYARYKAGSMSADGYDFNALDAQVKRLGVVAMSLLE
jgi:aminoglycoside phosphotransferase (APT) family kinase protein